METIKCSNCNGEGVVVHPFWRLYFLKHKGEDPKEVLRRLSGEFKCNLPPKEIDCPICQGKGCFPSVLHQIFFETTEGECEMTFEEFLIAISKLKNVPQKEFQNGKF